MPASAAGHRAEPEFDLLSNILREFNDQFGNIPWNDPDRVARMIAHDVPAKVAADAAYQNARQNSDQQNARIEHDKALGQAMNSVLKDDTQFFKQYSDKRVLPKLPRGLGVSADLLRAGSAPSGGLTPTGLAHRTELGGD